MLEVGVGTGINLIAVSEGLQDNRHRPVGLDAREGARACAKNELSTSGSCRWMPRPDVSGRLVRHRLRAVSRQRRARPGRSRARDAAGLPSRRAHDHPQSFPQFQPIVSSAERAISPLTVHIGFKSDLDLPAFLAQAELDPGLDREGEYPANLVAGHVYQGLANSGAAVPLARRCTVTVCPDAPVALTHRCTDAPVALNRTCRTRRTCTTRRTLSALWRGKLRAMTSGRLFRQGAGVGLVIAFACAGWALSAREPGRATQDVVTLDISKPGPPISPTMYGVFFEDINFAADGGVPGVGEKPIVRVHRAAVRMAACVA